MTTAPTPDLSQTFQNNPDSRLNRLICYARLESLMARAPAALRHRIAARRNPHFRRALLLAEGRDGDYELAGMRRMNCIFVHVPKAAGVSVAMSLFGSRAGGHFPLFMYLWLYGSKRFDAMFKFAIVRHPQARLLSAFRFLSKGGMLETDRRWASRWLSECESVDAFVQERLPLPEVRDALHFRPQTCFLMDPRTDELGVDYLGKVESLDQDMGCIRSVLGVKNELQTLNRSDSQGLGMSLSLTSRRIIRDIYAEDYEVLGYE